MAERGQFLTISSGNSRSIAQESGEKWTVPPFLQPISFKSDRLLARIILAILVLAALSLALRQDLANLALRHGTARLQAGDAEGARAAIRQAVDLGMDGAPLSYNLGVTYYRKGEFVPARKQFDSAIATAGPKLMPAVLYNRGNSLFRQAERLAAQDRQTAMRLFEAAIADYGKALALAPGAADARGNLRLAQTRMLALAAGRGQPGQQRTGAATQNPTSGDGNESRAGAQAASDQRKPAGKSASGKDRSGNGKSRRDMTQTEVERLLNDARGREKPAGRLQGDAKAGQLARPDKDW